MASTQKPRVLPPGMAHSRRSAILLLAGVVATSMPLPYTGLAAVPLVWAGVESIRAIRAMSGGRAPARGIVWSAIGLAMVCALTVSALLPYAVYGPAKGLQDCLKGANTAVATGECKAHFYGDVDPFLRGFLGV
ncbi:MAG: hypothetical protein ABI474_01310 [Actinomycetota bacterium]